MPRLGYIIISHEDDYKNLDKTVSLSADALSHSDCIIFWSGNKEKYKDAVNYLAPICTKLKEKWDCNCYYYAPTDRSCKCLESRLLAFNMFVKEFPNCSHVQFIDSGDFIDYEYDKRESCILNKERYVNSLQFDGDMYWSPVLISKDELEYMLYYDAGEGYNSFNLDASYYSSPFVVFEKSNVEKMGESLTDVSVPDARCWGVSDSSVEVCREFWGYKSQLYKGDCYIDRDDWSIASPSIVAYPWRVELVRKTFEAINDYYGNFDVNMAEDLLFHTVARCLVRDVDGERAGNPFEVNCKLLPPTYHYMAHEGSLTRSPYTIEKKLEVAKISGFCAEIITQGFPQKCQAEKPKDEVAEKSRDKKSETSKMEVKEFTTKTLKVFQPSQKMWVWNKDDFNGRIRADVILCEPALGGLKFVTDVGSIFEHGMIAGPNEDMYKVEAMLVAKRYVSKEFPWDGNKLITLTNQVWNSDPYFKEVAGNSDSTDLEIQNITKL